MVHVLIRVKFSDLRVAKNMTIKILLFGNKGQVGREIEELAVVQGLEVCGFDIDSVDITDFNQVENCFINNNVDIAINAAGYTAVDKAEDEATLAYAVNCDAVKNLAIVCSKYDVPLLHISTDYVFSGQKNTPYVEDDVVIPLNVYGKSKLAGEEILEQSWYKHIILRVSWMFGKYGNNFVKTILRLAKEREELQVVGDQHGCPTAAADVARVLLELARQIVGGKTHWGIYHYCGFPATTWYEFAKTIIEQGQAKFDFKIKHLYKVTTAEYITKAVRPKKSELLVSKITIDYGVVRHGWVDYLQNMINTIET